MKWIATIIIISICIVNAIAQGVGVGITTPLSKLHVRDGALLIDGAMGITPTNVPGIRLMWIPEKRSLRMGEVSGNQWNNDSIGLWSLAFGYNTVAKQSCAVSIGSSTRATGNNSVAFGVSTLASGVNST